MMEKSNAIPLVSILTPCYNGEKYISRFLESVLNQTYPNMELILINDGSTDNTENIILSYELQFREKNINFIYLTQSNQGQAAAINKGLKMYRGEYLTWPDSDDELHPDNILEKVNFLEKNDTYGLVLCKSKVIDDVSLKIVGELKRKLNSTSNDDLFSDLIYERNVYFAPGGYMIRSSFFKIAVPSQQIFENRGGQNWQMLLPMAYSYKCGYIDQYLYNYFIRHDSHSREKLNFHSAVHRFDEHEELLINTIQRIDTMTMNEKEYWISQIHQKYLRKKLYLASDLRISGLLNQIYVQLKEQGWASLHDYIIVLNGRYMSIRLLRKSFLLFSRLIKRL